MKKRFIAGALALFVSVCTILTPVSVNAEESSRLTAGFDLEGIDTGEAVVDESYENENENSEHNGTLQETDVSANDVSGNRLSLQ